MRSKRLIFCFFHEKSAVAQGVTVEGDFTKAVHGISHAGQQVPEWLDLLGILSQPEWPCLTMCLTFSNPPLKISLGSQPPNRWHTVHERNPWPLNVDDIKLCPFFPCGFQSTTQFKHRSKDMRCNSVHFWTFVAQLYVLQTSSTFPTPLSCAGPKGTCPNPSFEQRVQRWNESLDLKTLREVSVVQWLLCLYRWESSKNFEVCARPNDIVNYTVMELSPSTEDNMCRIRVAVEARAFGATNKTNK